MLVQHIDYNLRFVTIVVLDQIYLSFVVHPKNESCFA